MIAVDTQIAPAPRPVRPALALRVGVTGTRTLPTDPQARESVARQVRAVLQHLKEEMAALAADPRLQGLYTADPDAVLRPTLRLLSPLAEGADRLVAETALDLGYKLEVALPFTQADYERDFCSADRSDAENAASLNAFRTLLVRAAEGALSGQPRILTLDGSRATDAAASYGAIGRLVARNCDLLIAVWNGRPGQGPGGTADTVRFALKAGPPVWWVDTNGVAEPAWVTSLTALRRPQTLDRGSAAEQRLDAYLAATMLPPPPSSTHAEGVLGRLCRGSNMPLPRFLGECLPLDSRWTSWLWHAERAVRRTALLAGERLEHWLERGEAWLRRHLQSTVAHPVTHADDALPSLPEEPTSATPTPGDFSQLPGAAPARYWSTIFIAPDRLADGYAARYRSSYTLVALLAAVAIMAGNTAVLWHAVKLPFTLLEVITLALLLLLVALNQLRHWHERWITYRLLAELCRAQQALAMLGRSLPIGASWRLARGGQSAASGLVEPGVERDAWIGWYFHATLRAAPLLTGHLAGAALNATRDVVARTLIGSQVQYHANRARDAQLQSRGLAGWGEVLLLVTVGLVVLKAALLLVGLEEALAGLVKGLGIGAVFLAVPSVAFIAFRAYAELEVLAESSAAMVATMQAAKERLGRLHAAETEAEGAMCPALVSQEFGAVVHELALEMLAETEGWAQLFKAKVVEAG